MYSRLLQPIQQMQIQGTSVIYDFCCWKHRGKQRVEGVGRYSLLVDDSHVMENRSTFSSNKNHTSSLRFKWILTTLQLTFQSSSTSITSRQPIFF